MLCRVQFSQSDIVDVRPHFNQSNGTSRAHLQLDVLDDQMKDLMRLDGDIQDCLDDCKAVWWQTWLVPYSVTLFIPTISCGCHSCVQKTMQTDRCLNNMSTCLCPHSANRLCVSCMGQEVTNRGTQSRKWSLPLSAEQMWRCRGLAGHWTGPK